MDDWQHFDDSRFSVQLRYPRIAADGEIVDCVETTRKRLLRIHILAPRSREVYFEVTKYDSLPAADEYQLHKKNLTKQFDTVTVTALKETHSASLPAYEYAFEWDKGRRVVLLIEREDGTYRLLYNPQFQVNLQILSTVQWLSLS